MDYTRRRRRSGSTKINTNHTGAPPLELQPFVDVVAVFDCGVCTVPLLLDVVPDDDDDEEDDDVVPDEEDEDEEDTGVSPHTFFPLLTF